MARAIKYSCSLQESQSTNDFLYLLSKSPFQSDNTTEVIFQSHYQVSQISKYEVPRMIHLPGSLFSKKPANIQVGGEYTDRPLELNLCNLLNLTSCPEEYHKRELQTDESSSFACPNSWIGDGYCDTNCNILECNYDDGDCSCPCDSSL